MKNRVWSHIQLSVAAVKICESKCLSQSYKQMNDRELKSTATLFDFANRSVASMPRPPGSYHMISNQI